MFADRKQAVAFALLGLVMVLWAGNSIIARAMSRLASRSEIDWRLSKDFFPRARAISTLACSLRKYRRRGISV